MKKLAWLVIISLCCALLPSFRACAAEIPLPEGTNAESGLLDPNLEDSSYVVWSIEQFNVTKVAKCGPGSSCKLLIDVLPWTEWPIKAEYVLKKNGVVTRKEITRYCKWSCSNAAGRWDTGGWAAAMMTSGAFTIKSTYTDSDGHTYKCAVYFTIKNVSVPNTAAMTCASAIRLSKNGINMINGYRNRYIKHYIENNRGLVNDDYLDRNHAYLNAARWYHVIYESFKTGTIIGAYDDPNALDTPVKAFCYENNGTRYIVYDYHPETTGNLSFYRFKASYERALSLYQQVGAGASNTVVTGERFGGYLAAFVSLVTGARAVIFQQSGTPKGPYEYAQHQHRYETAAHYSGNSQTFYSHTALESVKYDFSKNAVTFTGGNWTNGGDILFSTLGSEVPSPKTQRVYYGTAGLDMVRTDDRGVGNYVYFGDAMDETQPSLWLLSVIRTVSDTAGKIGNILDVKDILKIFGRVPGASFNFKNFALGKLIGQIQSLADSQPNVWVGGKGNDKLYGSVNTDYYLYNKGDGSDTITDVLGDDRVYFIDAVPSEVYCEIKDDGTVVCYCNTSKAATFPEGSKGGGSIHVYTGYPGNEKEVFYKERSIISQDTKIYGHVIACPVDVKVYDAEHQLVAFLEDGVESETSNNCGYFYSVRTDGGEYVKCCILLKEECQIVVTGKDEGTLDYVASSCDLSDSTIQSDSLSNIPVHAGTVYRIDGSFNGSRLMEVDWDGDGNTEEVLSNDTGISLDESEKELSLGESAYLHAHGSKAETEIAWVSSDEGIAVVDQSGMVTAVGVGQAYIVATASNGTGNIAYCTLVVPDESCAVSDISIDGLESSYEYTGLPIEPEITLRYKALSLLPETDYSLQYRDNVEIGTATITVEGIGRFTGSKEITFSIRPKSTSVPDKVAKIARECRKAEVTGEYDTALWLHDWLIYNADYDYTYTNYGPEGVLLQGMGVCQSYSLAYQLLLDEFDIENMVISATEMDHAWNLVKLEGKWCHIDCTWDDPGFGGEENHTYFGMNNAMLARDHQWKASAFPVSESLDNYYPLRMGMLCFSNSEELTQIMAEQAELKASPITLLYIGTDSSYTTLALFEEWFSQNNWKYGLRSYGASYSDYSCTLQIEYTDPWEQPDTHLFEPVPAPAFTLNSPQGKYKLEDYNYNGLVLVFGRDGCMNTAGLLDRLRAELPALYEGGIDVLVCVDDAVEEEDLWNMKQTYGDFHYTYSKDSLLWNYLGAVGYSGSNVTYPCVFVINSQQMITYYSTGYVTNMDVFIGESFAVATGNALPQPDTSYDLTPILNGSGNVNDLTGDGIVQAVQAASKDRNVLLLLGYTVQSQEAALLEYYESHHELFDLMGLSMVASFYQIEEDERLPYPHCVFADYSGSDFWELLYAAGFPYGQTAYYVTSMFISKGGDIKAYTNRDLLDISDCTIYMARTRDYAARIPKALTELDSEAFAGTSFESIDLSGGHLQRICSRAFTGCSRLKLIRIPESVSEIADDAFADCGDIIFVCPMGSVAHDYALDHGYVVIYG